MIRVVRGLAPLPALLVLLLAGGASLTVPLLVTVLFDGVLPQATPGPLRPIAAALAGAALVQGLLRLAGMRALLREGFCAAERSGRRAWALLVSLPLSSLQRRSPVETATQAEASAEAARRREEFLEAALPAALLALPNLGLMIVLEPFLAAMTAGFVTAAAGATVLFRHRRRTAIFRIFERRAMRDARLSEAFHGLAKLRLAGAEDWVLRQWRERSTQLAGGEFPLHRSQATALGLLAGSAALSCAMLFAICSRSELSLGDFLGFFAASGAFTSALRVIATSWPMRWNVAALEHQAAPLLQSPTDRRGRSPDRLTGEVEVRGLTFGYTSKPVVRDFSLHVQPGEMVVISGRSGSGKSTIQRLLLGFAEPGRGEIYFDGHNLAELDLASVRSRIGVVLQNPFLSQGSILQNIMAGDDLPLDEAWRAAELAGLAEEIRALPMGMHSLIGANGIHLSTGNRQRLALARALVRRPDLLLLDEPAAGLDLRTRTQIWAALKGMRLTRILFTHRAEPRTADRFFLLEDGHLREG